MIFMFEKKKPITNIIKSDALYKTIFSGYMGSTDIGDISNGSYAIRKFMPYFSSKIKNDVFSEKIYALLEEKKGRRYLEAQKERADIIIKKHKVLSESELDILNYYKEIDFLSKKEFLETKKSIILNKEDFKVQSNKWYKTIYNANKIIRFHNGYKGGIKTLNKTKLKYLKDFETISILDNHDNVTQIIIAFKNKTFAIDVKKFYSEEYMCKGTKLIKFINYVLKDNKIKDRLIVDSNVHCDLISCFLGRKSTVEKILEKYKL